LPRINPALNIAGRLLATVVAGGMSLAGIAHLSAIHSPAPARMSESPRTAAAPYLAKQVPPAPPRAAEPIPSAALALDHEVSRLGQGFSGNVGIVVRDVQTGWTSHYRGLDYFPQQSVSKLWVALSLLDQIDRGVTGLSDEIVVRPEDLTLFHQPVRPLALRPGGFRTTNEDLLVRALTQSDNSANDRLLNLVGGPGAVRTTMAQKGILGVRFGPGETRLQSQIAGLEWRPEYRSGNRFAEAREALPEPARRSAFDAYVADPVDGATPLGIADALARLQQGRLLSPESTDRMLSIMGHTRTGAQRLKGGLRQGWSLSHKTGTGQILQSEQAGYNDVGILTSPAGNAYALAVLIGRTSQPLPVRMRLMQRVVAATIEYDAQLAAQRAAASRPHAAAELSS
jgi:beta-lactamase class A